MRKQIDLFDFTSFFACTFFNCLAHCVIIIKKKLTKVVFASVMVLAEQQLPMVLLRLTNSLEQPQKMMLLLLRKPLKLN